MKSKLPEVDNPTAVSESFVSTLFIHNALAGRSQRYAQSFRDAKAIVRYVLINAFTQGSPTLAKIHDILNELTCMHENSTFTHRKKHRFFKETYETDSIREEISGQIQDEKTRTYIASLLSSYAQALITFVFIKSHIEKTWISKSNRERRLIWDSIVTSNTNDLGRGMNTQSS